MKRLLLSFGCFFTILLGIVSVLNAAENLENRVFLNEDNSHFFSSRSADDMTIEGLNAFVDQYADTVVTDLVLCPNASRANFRNPARDAIWDPNSEGVEPADNWPQNCKLLDEKGLDPYKIWISRCREKNIKPWLSMRMNDLHCVDDTTNFMHSSFWVKHPELWRVPNDTSGVWGNRALNFKHAEARKHLTDFIDVLLERYDTDGLELDWMRFGWHLTPGHEKEEGHFLTEVVAYTREKANEWGKKRGHKIDVAVRVPAHPDAAAGLGMDAVEWAKQGLVDLIVPCPFWATCDFDIPMELWAERLAGTNVPTAPGIEYCVRSFPGSEMTPCTLGQLYGFAALEKFRGATNVYLFNWMDCDTLPVEKAVYRQMLTSRFDTEFLASVEREVPLTYRDTVPDGFDNNAQLPKSADSPAVFRIPAGPLPTAGINGVMVVFSKRNSEENAKIFASLNGAEAESAADLENAYPTDGQAVFFTFDKSAFKEGNNEFSLTVANPAGESIIFVSAKMNGK